MERLAGYVETSIYGYMQTRYSYPLICLKMKTAEELLLKLCYDKFQQNMRNFIKCVDKYIYGVIYTGLYLDKYSWISESLDNILLHSPISTSVKTCTTI